MTRSSGDIAEQTVRPGTKALPLQLWRTMRLLLLTLLLITPCLAQDVLLIDGHNDAPWRIRDRLDGKVDFRREPRLQTDLERMRKGGVGAQFWSVWVPTSLKGPEATRVTFEQIALVKRLVAENPADMQLALSADDIESARGKIASLIGVEGGHALDGSLDVLRELYRQGARYLTLAHGTTLDWVDSATDDPRSDGLSPFGVEVVRTMNELGMLVDLSHCSPATMQDALDVSTAPVLFSHSCARALVDHPRNVPDEILTQLRAKDGLVMVAFTPSFVSEECRQDEAAYKAEEARVKYLLAGQPARQEAAIKLWEEQHPRPRATVAQVADHIDHIRKVAGLKHVGIGSDFDGIDEGPVGLEDVSGYPALLAELRRRGYTEEEVRMVAGGNLLRILRKAEAVRLVPAALGEEPRRAQRVRTCGHAGRSRPGYQRL